MKALALAKKRITREVQLEDQIAELMNYGKPRMHCHDDLTWSANVKLNTDQIVEGAEVKSGFNHPTIGSAVTACLEKCRQLNG